MLRYATQCVTLVLGALLSCAALNAATPWPLGTYTPLNTTPPAPPAGAGYTVSSFKVQNCPNVTADAFGYLAVAPHQGTPRGLVLFFTGGSGKTWWSNITPACVTMADQLRAAGFMIAQVRWSSSWWQSTAGNDAGVGHLACRPATVIQYVYNNYYLPLGISASFCVCGNSGGSAQAAYAPIFYGLDDEIDVLIPSGGPPFSALAKSMMNYPAESAYWLPGELDAVDRAHGYFSNGPAVRHDPAFIPRWQQEGLATGGDDYTRHNKTCLIYGALDQQMQVIGRDLYDRWIAGGSTNITWQVIPATGHNIYMTAAGRDAVLTAILSTLPPSNRPPVIASDAYAYPNPVTFPNTTTLGVVASDPDGGPQLLTYTWELVSGPGAATFTPNGTAASDFTTVTVTAPGTYTFRVTVSDGQDSVTSEVNVIVNAPSTTTTVKIYASAGDGVVIHEGSTSWAAAHDATVGTSADSVSAARDINVSHYAATGRYELRRGFFTFDTSIIPQTATIQSAALKLYVNSKVNGDNDGDDFCVVTQNTQASATLTKDDYDEADDLECSERQDLGVITTGYNTWRLNVIGVSLVCKAGNTGPTKFAFRMGHDVQNQPIASGKTNKIAVKFSEQTGTSQDPYLEITFSLP